jgi:hypothetical protein
MFYSVEIRGLLIFKKSKNHLKIVGARVVMLNKFNTEGQKILGVTVKNIRCHCTKFSRHEYLAPGVCAALLEISLLETNTSAKLPIAYLRYG